MSDPCETKDLRKAAGHVAHEIRMLASAWNRHRDDRHAWVGWFVHARTLMEFFWPECRCTSEKDHVCAWHFYVTQEVDETGARSTWREHLDSVGSPPPQYGGDDEEDYRYAANKLAAHLTYTRVEIAERQKAEGKFTPNAEITAYLLGLARMFLDTLPEGRVGWFGKLDMV